jgi:serine beta-lactamase-like protein LACTB
MLSSVLVFLALLSLSAQRSLAQESKLAPEKKARLEDSISKFMAANKIPGLSAAAIVNGETVWSEGFGMADLENFVPATPRTLYRLASISKPLTATAALELWERGKLDLDAPVQKYCPSFPVKPWPITPRQALGHLAGIRHYRPQPAEEFEVNNTKHFDNPIEAGLNFFKDDPLLQQPGTKFHYSTQGYTLVGCVIEGASGEKYADFMRKNVFQPAAMTHTQVDDRYAIIQSRTRFYKWDVSGAVANADLLDSSYKIPGGGWLSSAEDIASFAIAMMNDQLVKRSTRDLMWTSQKTSDGTPTNYGLGWGIDNKPDSRKVGHTGSQQGTSTSMLLAPEQRSGIVVLINADGADAFALSEELLRILLDPSIKH